MTLSRYLVLLLLPLTACTLVWTELRAAEVADGLFALPSYKARYVERGILPDRPQAEVVRELQYQRPGKVRVETLAPADRKGDLYVFDGQTAIYWWPAELIGIRIQGMPMPDEKAIRAHIKRAVGAALHDYAWSLRETVKLAGQPTEHWTVLPMSKGPYYLPFEEWRHTEYHVPMKIAVTGQDGKPWYGFEFTRFELNASVPDKTFAFEFPANALVFEWNLADANLSLDEARKTMNFTVREPGQLPEGHRINKRVRARGQVPMLATLMEQGASVLSLTQYRYAGRGDYRLPVGKPVQIGKTMGYANFFGGSTTLNWKLDETELTLVGNLPLAEMVAVAASVK